MLSSYQEFNCLDKTIVHTFSILDKSILMTSLRKIFIILFCFAQFNFSQADSRIKDIVYFEGIRDNMLIGYGLVVGLNGTGDNLKNSAFTEKGLSDFLLKLGVSTKGANLKTKNIAAVVITATLPPFSRAGSKINVTISTIGDAKSLRGGSLLATPLLGADGEVYAVAQGIISVGLKPDDEGKGSSQNLTAGYIANGAIIEKEIEFNLSDLSSINLALKNPDISTARSIETAINSSIREEIAFAKDPGTVQILVPNYYKSNIVALLADIENITVNPDQIAKIVIDEATGTIVIGENVKISKVAIAQGNIIVKVSDDADFSFSIGATNNAVKNAPSKPGEEIAVMKESTKLSDLIEGLNSLGLKPKDLVSILKAIKQAGALQAEIETK